MAKKVKCNHCDYIWKYKGEKLFASCPNCLLKVNVAKRKVKEE